MIDDFRRPPKPKHKRPVKAVVSNSRLSSALNPRQIGALATEPRFQTPEQVMEIDEQDLASIKTLDEPMKQMPKRVKKLELGWPPTKRTWVVLGIALAVLVVAFCGWFYLKPNDSNLALLTVSKKVPAKPKTVASNLTGLQVDPSLNKLPVTGVMIENSLDARPQSGLGQAGVVFEAIAEGGVTRFLALFQDTSPSSVGPVRSARPYYIQWDLGFDAPYAHVGGSPDGLADIKAWGAKDMNQFYNSGSFQRVTSRAAPHNVYTSIAKLNQLESAKGFGTSKFTPWTRKKDKPIKVPTAASIDLSLSGPIYNPHYDYDATTNSYKRSENGAPHMDANTNTQISPKVVIAMVVGLSRGALDATGAYYSNYQATGSGTAYVFQDGAATTGTWTKNSNTDMITFTDANGVSIKLNTGQTWVTAVANTGAVTYK